MDPLPPVEKKRRGARSADSSSVHYRRSSVHIRRETRPKTGSTDRFREPHAPSDPGTHTTAPLSLSPSLPTSCSSLAPSCVSSKVSRASKVSVPLSCRLEAATSATRPRDPRMWAAVFAYHAIFQAWDASSRYASSRINVITGEILHRTERDTVEGLNSIRFFFFFSNE